MVFAFLGFFLLTQRAKLFLDIRKEFRLHTSSLDEEESVHYYYKHNKKTSSKLLTNLKT